MNLNSDLGEGSVNEEKILRVIDSANIACGAHAGSMSVSIATAWRCGQLGIEVGAHPGYEDRAEFGRVERALSAKEIEALVAFQVAGLTLIDMTKGVERGVYLESVRLLEKSGGRSGTWKRSAGT